MPEASADTVRALGSSRVHSAIFVPERYKPLVELLYGSPVMLAVDAATRGSESAEMNTLTWNMHLTGDWGNKIRTEYLINLTTHINNKLGRHGRDVATYNQSLTQDDIDTLTRVAIEREFAALAEEREAMLRIYNDFASGEKPPQVLADPPHKNPYDQLVEDTDGVWHRRGYHIHYENIGVPYHGRGNGYDERHYSEVHVIMQRRKLEKGRWHYDEPVISPKADIVLGEIVRSDIAKAKQQPVVAAVAAD